MKRRIAEAAGWICLLAVWLVAAAMDCGAVGPWLGGAIALGLELVGALALCKAGVVRLPEGPEGRSDGQA